MKVILVIYLILEALAAYYLYLQLGGEVARHLMLSGPAILLYIAACYKDVDSL